MAIETENLDVAPPIHTRTIESVGIEESEESEESGGSESVTVTTTVKGEAESLYVQLSIVAQRKEQLEKAVANRQIEYEKTKPKHAEFPSIPEMQNKQRARDEKTRKDLERREAEIKIRLLALREDLVKQTGKLLLGANFHSRPELALPQPTDKDFDGKITNLEKRFAEHLDQWTKVNEDMKKRQDELQKDAQTLQGAITDIAEELDTKLSKDSLGQQREAFQLQLQQLRKEMEASFESRLLQQKEESKKELAAALSNHEEKIRQELQAALSISEGKSKKESEMAISNLEKETKRTLEAAHSAMGEKTKVSAEGIDSLRKEIGSLRSELSNLADTIDKSLNQLRQQVADARIVVTTHDQRLEKCEKSVSDHAIQLGNIDMAIWDEIADLVSFEFPDMKNKVESVRSELEKLARMPPQQSPAPPQRIPTLSPSPAGQPAAGAATPHVDKAIQDFLNDKLKRMVDILGGVVDTKALHTKQLVEGVGQRVQDLEQQRASDSTGINALKTRVAAVEEQTASYGGHVSKLSDQVASLEEQAASDHARLDSLVSAEANAGYLLKGDLPPMQVVEALKLAFHKVQADSTQAQQEIAALQALIAQKSEYFDSLKHQMSALNSRHENLRTEELAKAILGQLETIYPTPGTIRSDLQESKKRLADIEETLQTLKQEGDINGRDIGDIVDTLMTKPVRADRPAKRQRLEHDHHLNGTANGISNGLVNGVSNGLNRTANGNHDY
ncbi:hypothetical protein OQA88_12223 [Cercophora sp. LCS_1]